QADKYFKYVCAHHLGPAESDPCPAPDPPAPDPRGGDRGQQFGSGDGCDPNYEGACLDPNAVDYDCERGSGDGADVTGTVTVVGDDHYGRDADGDGIGCEDSSDPSTDYGDPSTDYPDAGTTGDFGSGSGSVGACADGTLSDSIGRPGACSHHGG